MRSLDDSMFGFGCRSQAYGYNGKLLMLHERQAWFVGRVSEEDEGVTVQDLSLACLRILRTSSGTSSQFPSHLAFSSSPR